MALGAVTSSSNVTEGRGGEGSGVGGIMSLFSFCFMLHLETGARAAVRPAPVRPASVRISDVLVGAARGGVVVGVEVVQTDETVLTTGHKAPAVRLRREGVHRSEVTRGGAQLVAEDLVHEPDFELVTRTTHVCHTLGVDTTTDDDVVHHVARHQRHVVDGEVVFVGLDHLAVPSVEQPRGVVVTTRRKHGVVRVPAEPLHVHVVVDEAHNHLLVGLHVQHRDGTVLRPEVDRAVRRAPHGVVDLSRTVHRVGRAGVVRPRPTLDFIDGLAKVEDLDAGLLTERLVLNGHDLTVTVRELHTTHRGRVLDGREGLATLHVEDLQQLIRTSGREHGARVVDVASPHRTLVALETAQTLPVRRVPHSGVLVLGHGEEQVSLFVVLHHGDGTPVSVDDDRPHFYLIPFLRFPVNGDVKKVQKL
eukprot:Hpha_TRINITY_DN15241_c2_g7::TRINITY_DN15241_c2_g7_i1::g.66277::m.66277